MHDAYAGMNELYLSMHSPEAARGENINDPVMAAWLINNAPDGASILDAGCGLGFDVLALHRGLPAQASGKGWTVYGADFSADMLSSAIALGEQAGIPRSRYRQASFSDLADAAEWHGMMDVVTVNYALYTQPSADMDYDAYLAASLIGLASVLRPGGHLVFSMRDWPALRHAEQVGTVHRYKNRHGENTYECRYTWTFDSGRVHRSELRMWRIGGSERSTEIFFAERAPAEIKVTLERTGFAAVSMESHGDGPHAFYTVVAKLRSN